MTQSKHTGIITTTNMVTYLTLLILLTDLILSTTAMNGPSSREELDVAIHEMQTANYFSFVMLIKMYPPDRIPGNVTFLMPNDRMLSQISLVEEGSMIPTSEPDVMLRVSNNGRRSFYLNNVQIISPNLCTAGFSIRCHGIKGVLIEPEHNKSHSSPTCSPPSSESATAPASPKGAAASASPRGAAPPASPKSAVPPTSPKSVAAPASPKSSTVPTSPPPSSPASSMNQIPMAAPPMNEFRKSGSSKLLPRGILHTVTPCVILVLAAFQIW